MNDIRQIEEKWNPHRSAITNIFTTQNRPKIKPNEYNDIDNLHRVARKNFSWLHSSVSTPPMIGIIGTLVAVLSSDLDNIISLSLSFQVALLTTIIGLFLAIIGRLLIAVVEPKYEHTLKEFESILETVFRSGSPKEM